MAPPLFSQIAATSLLLESTGSITKAVSNTMKVPAGESVRVTQDASTFVHPAHQTVVGDVYTVAGILASQVVVARPPLGTTIAVSIDHVVPFTG